MLKIKDNVDLKELEKYGFRRLPIKNGELSEYRRSYYSKPDTITIVIDETREVIDKCTAFTYDWGEVESDSVDDLIKDGLVEKVDN